MIGGILVTHASGATGMPTSAQACSWRQVLSVPGGWFSGVAAGAGGAVWAVGYQTPRGTNKTYPLISTWNGKTWSTTVGKGFGQHEDVLASVGGDVWTTGLRNGRPVLNRFDGQRWTTAFREVYFGNSQRSGAVWMLEGRQLIRIDRRGRETRLELPSAIEEVGLFTADARGRVWVDDTIAEKFHHWDGRRWSTYRYPGAVYLLYEMATGSPSNVWAVGNEIAHWDGRKWKELRLGGEDEVLYDVDVLADKALAVGQDWGRWNVHGVIAESEGTKLRRSYFGQRSRSNPPDCTACDISTVEAFEGVTFVTKREAWAVGFGDAGNDTRGVVFRGSCT